MNPYEKLDHEHRAWTVEETADFLGYSKDHLRRLMREGKIDGCWMRVRGGRPAFCPAKLKIWMEQHFNAKGNRRRSRKAEDAQPTGGEDPGVSSQAPPASEMMTR